jgi:signal peptidase I
VVIQNRLGPLLSGVSPGDLVTLLSPESGEPIVKRVVATGGQSVEIYGGRLLVDGQTANEPYVDMHNMSGIFFGPVAVPTGKIFLMGDNRLDSIDSRDFGPVDSGVVQGTILLTMPLGARQ